ncbi:uncharacterized protein LOC143876180 isoform X2 [Tasmannia lanceolata]|uniref:uncharacterized protein LOC143876180 isoform X2 n=1 Tax=Tasmannia lanceolata TaxID=3420 RepID=UPI00406284F8
MASLHLAKSNVSPFFTFRSDSSRKSRVFFSEEENIFQLQMSRSSKSLLGKGFRVCCRFQDGEDPPESLFMKELKKRGMTPASLLEDSKMNLYGLSENEIRLKDDSRGLSKRNGVVSTDFEKNLSNQREVSMALNSEGLEGLIPRAKLLLTIGGTFFLGFWPLILLTVAFFSALYFYFGPGFVHDASNMDVAPPPYIDPYKLLEDERLPESAPQIK